MLLIEKRSKESQETKKVIMAYLEDCCLILVTSARFKAQERALVE
jgi:hypothetical protein